MDYLDIQISLDGARRRHQRRGPRRGLLRHGPPGDGPPRRRRLRAVQDLGRRHPPQRRPARRVQGARRLATAPSCGSPGCARRAAAPTRGTSCTRPTTSSASSTAGCSPRRRRPHRRLVLPPLRARRAAARPQPVRRRPGRVPHRPDRRRLRLPVRASTTSSRPARCATPAGSPRVWRDSELFRRCASRSRPGACARCGSYDACQGGCMAAKFFVGLPLDGPDPECVNGHGEPAARRRRPGGAPRARRPTTRARRPSPSPASRWAPPRADGTVSARHGAPAASLPHRRGPAGRPASSPPPGSPATPSTGRRRRSCRRSPPASASRSARWASPSASASSWVWRRRSSTATSTTPTGAGRSSPDSSCWRWRRRWPPRVRSSPVRGRVVPLSLAKIVYRRRHGGVARRRATTGGGPRSWGSPRRPGRGRC